jgi:hypothetical protein
MKAQLETHDGKVTLKVYYDPVLCNREFFLVAHARGRRGVFGHYKKGAMPG